MCPKDGVKAVFVDDSPQVDPLIGATLDDRYRVTDRIGEGGMGAVYKAEQITMGRPVALKVLRPELASDPDIVKRFLREVKAISMLSHPNLITVHDFGQTDAGLLYIAMEYLGGDTLTDAIKRGPLPIAECLRLVAEIASAMAEAHSKGVIHRDLKPDNVMLVERGDGVTG